MKLGGEISGLDIVSLKDNLGIHNGQQTPREL